LKDKMRSAPPRVPRGHVSGPSARRKRGKERAGRRTDLALRANEGKKGRRKCAGPSTHRSHKGTRGAHGVK
ncbi:hypothetical protein KI387_016811, partial [Taxus chinensis]